MYVCRNLNSLWFHSTGLSFSPFQNSALNYVLATSTLVYVSTFRIFLHWISDEYCVEDSPVSWSCLVLHVWDSVPNWSDDGSISCLVCVCVYLTLSLSLSHKGNCRGSSHNHVAWFTDISDMLEIYWGTIPTIQFPPLARIPSLWHLRKNMSHRIHRTSQSEGVSQMGVPKMDCLQGKIPWK